MSSIKKRIFGNSDIVSLTEPGIEPGAAAWERGVWPLHHHCLDDKGRILGLYHEYFRVFLLRAYSRAALEVIFDLWPLFWKIAALRAAIFSGTPGNFDAILVFLLQPRHGLWPLIVGQALNWKKNVSVRVAAFRKQPEAPFHSLWGLSFPRSCLASAWLSSLGLTV